MALHWQILIGFGIFLVAAAISCKELIKQYKV